MDIRERETLALVAALTEFQVEIPKMETIQPIFTYPLEMNPLTPAAWGRRGNDDGSRIPDIGGILCGEVDRSGPRSTSPSGQHAVSISIVTVWPTHKKIT